MSSAKQLSCLERYHCQAQTQVSTSEQMQSHPPTASGLENKNSENVHMKNYENLKMQQTKSTNIADSKTLQWTTFLISCAKCAMPFPSQFLTKFYYRLLQYIQCILFRTTF